LTVALTLPKGYLVLEEDMTMSLEAFADKYGREDGEPECVNAACDNECSINCEQPLAPQLLLQS
jgi:hypothetical protein